MRRAVLVILVLMGALLAGPAPGAGATATPEPEAPAPQTPAPATPPPDGQPAEEPDAEEDPGPALSVVGPESVVFEIEPAAGVRRGPADGSAHVLVANSGPEPARVQVADVLLDDPPGDCGVEVVAVEEEAVPAHGTAAIQVSLRAQPACADETGTLVLTSDPPAPPVTARFQLARTDVRFEYVAPAGIAVIAAAVLAGFLWSKESSDDPIDLGPAFTFKDSWLTTVSTFTALLGTVFTTTGVIQSLLPGVETDKLLTLNFVFGGIVVAAPVAYAALSRWGWAKDARTSEYAHRTYGTRAALIVASCTTLVGVVGQLGTVGILVYEAPMEVPVQILLGVGLAAIALAAWFYAYRWTASALKGPAGTVAEATGGNGSGTL